MEENEAKETYVLGHILHSADAVGKNIYNLHISN
jgi:hypothetical protein